MHHKKIQYYAVQGIKEAFKTLLKTFIGLEGKNARTLIWFL
jgi:hypothetical protein